MNKVVLIGRLGDDPKYRTTQSGVANCTFPLAVSRPYTKDGNRETDWLAVVCWRGTAEFVCKYFSKGSMIAVDGSIQTRSYDAQDGSKRYVTEIIASNVEFCGSNNSDRHGGNAAVDGAMADYTDDDLPF